MLPFDLGRSTRLLALGGATAVMAALQSLPAQAGRVVRPTPPPGTQPPVVAPTISVPPPASAPLAGANSGIRATTTGSVVNTAQTSAVPMNAPRFPTR